MKALSSLSNVMKQYNENILLPVFRLDNIFQVHISYEDILDIDPCYCNKKIAIQSQLHTIREPF
jgi:hypothetical protein